MGTLTGFVVMAIALAPFYRKFGAFTLPSYLGRRFESRGLRIVAAVVAAVPMLLVLSAELRIGAGVAGHLIALNPNLIVCVLALSVAITTAPPTPGGSVSLGYRATARQPGTQTLTARLSSPIIRATPVVQTAVTVTKR